jgi:hypothetical protein
MAPQRKAKMLPQLPVTQDEAAAFLLQHPIIFKILQKGETEAIKDFQAWIKGLPDDEAAVAISSFGAFIDPVDLLPFVEEAARVYRNLAPQSADWPGAL